MLFCWFRNHWISIEIHIHRNSMLILQWWDIPQPTFGFESQFHIIYWICSFCIYAVFTVDICNFLQWIWIFFFMYKIKQFPSCYIVPTFQLSGRTAVKTASPPEKVAYICYEKMHIHSNSNITITRTQTEAENTLAVVDLIHFAMTEMSCWPCFLLNE